MRFLTHSHDSILKILTINWKTQARMTPGFSSYISTVKVFAQNLTYSHNV